MPTIKLDIVTAERSVFSEDVDMVIAPGVDGQLGILPYHAPLMTTLVPGELVVKRDGSEFCLAISGGFLEVRPDRVIVLADSAERAEEIDVSRAQEARLRAEKLLAEGYPAGVDSARVEASLRRSLIRLKVATRRRKRHHPEV